MLAKSIRKRRAAVLAVTHGRERDSLCGIIVVDDDVSLWVVRLNQTIHVEHVCSNVDGGEHADHVSGFVIATVIGCGA